MVKVCKYKYKILLALLFKLFTGINPGQTLPIGKNKLFFVVTA